MVSNPRFPGVSLLDLGPLSGDLETHPNVSAMSAYANKKEKCRQVTISVELQFKNDKENAKRRELNYQQFYASSAIAFKWLKQERAAELATLTL